MGRTRRIVTAAGLVATLALTTAPAALASHDDVTKTGSCSGRSDWKLKVGTDDGRLDGEFEVDQNVNGQVWRVRVFRDDVRIFRGRRTTLPPSGSFEVDFRAANPPGPNVIKARAVNLGTGEMCRARLRF